MDSALSCFLNGLQAPSMNSLLSVFCVGGRPKFETKMEVRLFRLKLTQKLPRWECPKEGALKVSLSFHGKSKRQDMPNLIKCVLDTLAARYRFNDVRVSHLTCQSVEDGRVGIGVEITHES